MSDDNTSAMLNEGSSIERSNDNQESVNPGDRDGGAEGLGGRAHGDVEGIVDTFNPGAVPPNPDIERGSTEAESPDIEADETEDTER